MLVGAVLAARPNKGCEIAAGLFTRLLREHVPENPHPVSWMRELDSRSTDILWEISGQGAYGIWQHRMNIQ